MKVLFVLSYAAYCMFWVGMVIANEVFHNDMAVSVMMGLVMISGVLTGVSFWKRHKEALS